MRERIRGADRAALSVPTIAETPINEFNRTEPLLSLAFPTLFPTGARCACVD
jgi:ATP-dependent DNA helicase PIF1